MAKRDFDGGLTAGVDAILKSITEGPPEVPGPGAVSQAAPPTNNPKISDLNWKRAYRIQGHLVEQAAEITRNGDKATGTYQTIVVLDGDRRTENVDQKIYNFTGQVEEVDGRVFIKNIQCTNGNFDNKFWQGPEGIRWIIGENAAYNKPHRSPNALPGKEGLILTFVADAEQKRRGVGPTYEQVLSLIHLSTTKVSATTQTTNDKAKSNKATVLNSWLETRPKWRAATEQDYDKTMTNGYDLQNPSAVPYCVDGDFNHDGVKDVAAILVNKKDAKKWAIAVFNGPFTNQNNEPAFFTDALNPQYVVVALRDVLSVGPYESDVGFSLTPTKTGYNLEVSTL